jgi:hypothetical protein
LFLKKWIFAIAFAFPKKTTVEKEKSQLYSMLLNGWLIPRLGWWE